MCECVGWGIHQRILTGERESKSKKKKKKKNRVLSVDVTDHFERRCLISFEIACARPTAMLWSLSILQLGCRQGWDLALCLLFVFFSVSVYLFVWVDEDGVGGESL